MALLVLKTLTKRKPFQILEGCAEDYIYINERFVLTLLLQAGNCYDENVNYYAADQKDLVKSIGQIYYHLKYRNTTPQTLELFLIGLENGRKMYAVN